MHTALAEEDVLFFSPAENSLPRHVTIRFWPIRFLKQLGVSLWLQLNALRVIDRHRLGVLNVHAGAGGVLLARRVPVPVVVTCHHTYRQQCRHIRSQFWKWVFVPFEKRTYRLATRVICVSEDTRRDLVDHYGIPEEKVSVIYNAVESGRFRPLGAGKIPDMVLYIGRIDKRKGIEFLIRSMPLVLRELPGARLVVGGKGGDLEKMKALVGRLHLESSVTFLGFVPDDRLNALYNQAQCVVVPSIFEGFGITVIEAVAAGTRVVGADVDGIRGILSDGAYGTVTPYGNRPGLAKAIVAELGNPRPAGPLGTEYQAGRFRERYREAFAGVGRGFSNGDADVPPRGRPL